MHEYIDREAFLRQEREAYCQRCDRRKNGNGKVVYEIGGTPCRSCRVNGVLRDIDDYPAADVVERPRWIPVEERLPEKSGNYLTAFGDGTALSTNIFMHPDDWLTEEGNKINPNGKWYFGEVTHWQELPEPPKEEDNG